MTRELDWLSQFLQGIHLTGQLEIRCAYGAPWVVTYERAPATEIPYHIVLNGHAVLEDTDKRTAVDLPAGSVVFLPHGSAHVLHDGSGRTPLTESRRQAHGFVVSENTGTDERLDMLCGRFRIAAPHDRLIQHYLPSVLVVQFTDPATVSDPNAPSALHASSHQLEALVGLMRAESMQSMPGGPAILDALSAALFTLTLRAAGDKRSVSQGLLALAVDSRLSPAISAMFADPAHPWTLPALASLCNMSRATFVRQFQAKLGRSASDMLTDVRMTLAATELMKPNSNVESVSSLVGYQSTPAFRRAFAAWKGMTPGQWRRLERPDSDSDGDIDKIAADG